MLGEVIVPDIHLRVGLARLRLSPSYYTLCLPDWR